jgi:hypothetical protein
MKHRKPQTSPGFARGNRVIVKFGVADTELSGARGTVVNVRPAGETDAWGPWIISVRLDDMGLGLTLSFGAEELALDTSGIYPEDYEPYTEPERHSIEVRDGADGAVVGSLEVEIDIYATFADKVEADLKALTETQGGGS